MSLSPTNRKRAYATGAAVFGILATWGVITVDEAAQLTEALDKLLAVALLLLARSNVNEAE